MSLFKKARSFLKEIFNDSSHPEPEVRKDMERQGWKFDFEIVAAPMCAVSVLTVTAPDGTKAFGFDTPPESRKLYMDALHATRVRLGLKPE
ncbi:MAG: hypothetical protein HYU57_04180 [Micavibrio aeruginosavorus]|nr:hypothetical protein [Micavibrio aeruginosavorus]